MPGLVLVVDDVPANIKLLEAKLTNEYYDVVTAKDGYEAIEKAKAHSPDLILLDVMMPGMDGFETCRKLKEDDSVSHIPVVMVTALSDPSDRVSGLEAGADDFITKPINDTSLFARVRSLIRIKVLIDELRLRDQSGSQMGVLSGFGFNADVSGAHILVIDDDAVQSKRIQERLGLQYKISIFADYKQALEMAKKDEAEIDLILISTQLTEIDGLRLATQFKAMEPVRHVPIIMLVDEDDQPMMLKGLELGVNDYLRLPIDFAEMQARMKTQIRRKKFQDALKSNYQESVSMAITDGLTKLYNRHYLDTHLKNLTQQSLETKRPLSLVIMDMDHFKAVNDTYGHDVGDEVLKHLSATIIQSIRSADLASRYGGEEFVVLMPGTDAQPAWDVAERIRRRVETTPIPVSNAVGSINKTISIGVSTLNMAGDTPEALLKRADSALYQAKNGGRNKVCPTVDVLLNAPQIVEVPDGSPKKFMGPGGLLTPAPVSQVIDPVAAMQQQNNYVAAVQAPMFGQTMHIPKDPPPATAPNAVEKPSEIKTYDLVRPVKQGSEKKVATGIDDEPPGTF